MYQWSKKIISQYNNCYTQQTKLYFCIAQGSTVTLFRWESL